MATFAWGPYVLYIRYSHMGGPANIRARVSRVPDITKDLVENSAARKVMEFQVSQFTSIFDPDDAVDHVEVVVQTNTRPEVHDGFVLTNEAGQDLTWPPPAFDPRRDDQLFRIAINFAGDGTPVSACWT